MEKVEPGPLAPLVHESLNLYISDDTFTFEPLYLDPSLPRQTLVISRADGQVTINAPPIPTLRQEEVLNVLGIVGIITLNAGLHLIVITDREKIGKIGGKDVYRLSNFSIIPFARSKLTLTEAQLHDDRIYLELLTDLLAARCFYFSYNLDLTVATQRQHDFPNFEKQSLWRRADDRFYWNRFLQQRLIDISEKNTGKDISSFIIPIMCGFVQIKETFVKDKRFTLALISRRSKFRAGTRFNARGIDDQGNVANFVETEQLVVTENGYVASYLQIRGSIPLFWKQITNVKYQPKLVVERNSGTAAAFKKHFTQLQGLYKSVIAVNLINVHGYEMPLGVEFARQVNMWETGKIKYIHFDFHKECRKMRWDRISLLVDQISDDLDSQGYCLLKDNGLALMEQSSIVRTNCIDCLDRTNVVQSVLARKVLKDQLVYLGFIEESDDVQKFEHLEKVFKNIWADNADEVSKQYSGTGALKTDFTRTGKRTKEGVLNDLMNSIIRYIKNNFLDGFRQDSYDLFLGNFVVDSRVTPFKTVSKPLYVTLLPVALVALISLIMLTFLLAERSLYKYLIILVFGAGIAVSVKLIIRFGPEFVDAPRLRIPNKA
ncbi:Phosphatidylinositide phosphatase SAC1 [Phlyctochytrium planicorne]|nr:Phosphatidylinositide phosphatase SAC1 [Phlyctochytrium planicorne]